MSNLQTFTKLLGTLQTSADTKISKHHLRSTTPHKNVLKYHTHKILNKYNTMLTFVKWTGCFQDNVYQQIYSYNYSTKKCLHFTHLTLLHHVSCVQKQIIWFYAVLLCLIPWLWSLVDWNMWQYPVWICNINIYAPSLCILLV